MKSLKTPPSKRPIIMGIVNITTDSFSDGNRYLGRDALKARLEELAAGGCDIFDVGPESSNPKGDDVSPDEQKRRLDLFFEVAAGFDLPVSIDSYYPKIIEHALKAGAVMVNDIRGLSDPAVRGLVRQYGAGSIAMFNRNFAVPRPDAAGGSEATREVGPVEGPAAEELTAGNVVERISDWAVDLKKQLRAEGASLEHFYIDTGMGFFLGQNPNLSFTVLRHLGLISAIAPLCLSVSRKSFLGSVAGLPPAMRGPETLAAELWGLEQGTSMIRTHDTAALSRAWATRQKIGLPADGKAEN